MVFASNKVLDTATTISVIAAVTKLGDLVLDSSQQARLQKYLDKLTLSLIDLSKLSWYPYLRNLKVVVALFILGFAIQEYVFLKYPGLLTINPFLDSVRFVVGLVVFAMLARKASLASSTKRFIFSLLPGFAAFPIFGAILFIFGEIRDLLKSDSFFGFVMIMVAFPLALALLALLISSAGFIAMLTVGVLAFACYCLIVFIRGLMWRIVSYSKGAWAAILFMVTGLLGIAEVVSKM